MQNHLIISKQSPSFPEYLDFQTLRKIGIEHLQRLSGKIWTDYNLHDPGITILEVLCYAITDLGYRNNLDTKDLLTPTPAPAPNQSSQAGKTDTLDSNFYTPDEILTCNPVTVLDIRKRLIDIKGVRNAWVETEDSPDPDTTIYINYAHSLLTYDQTDTETPSLNIKGLYTVYLDIDWNIFIESSKPLEEVIKEVTTVLLSHRNLCEDFDKIVVLHEESIGLKATIELNPEADPEETLIEIYTQIQNFLAPHLRFYTLQEMLDKGKSIDEIFAGRPSALPEHDWGTAYNTQLLGHYTSSQSHGFIDTNELEALTLPKIIYTSHLYQIILNISNIRAVQNLSIDSHTEGLSKSLAYPWYLHLTEKSHRPVLGIDYSYIQFTKHGRPVPVDQEEVKRRYKELYPANLANQKNAYDLDLSIPKGTHYDIADHYSIHHDFPPTYGISSDKLPESETQKRKAQAMQLKGYLIFYDQVLANYLSQLSQVRTLFSWDKDKWPKKNQNHTYFSQALDFPGVEEIIQKDQYADFLQTIIEDAPTALERRDRLLDHLLARFSEKFTDYVLNNYDENPLANHEVEILHNKARLLKEYPAISRDRFRAFNYYPSTQSPPRSTTRPDISGFQHRVARLLQIEEADPLKCSEDGERFYLLEHILLRPRKLKLISDGKLISDDIIVRPYLMPISTDGSQENTNLAANDPYSFWISAIFPNLSNGRFNDPTFRQFVESTIRLEAPAHIAIKIGWFNQKQMTQFEQAYHTWMVELKLSTIKEKPPSGFESALNCLVNVLSKLQSVPNSKGVLLANSQSRPAHDSDKIILR